MDETLSRDLKPPREPESLFQFSSWPIILFSCSLSVPNRHRGFHMGLGGGVYWVMSKQERQCFNASVNKLATTMELKCSFSPFVCQNVGHSMFKLSQWCDVFQLTSAVSVVLNFNLIVHRPKWFCWAVSPLTNLLLSTPTDHSCLLSTSLHSSCTDSL